MIILDLASRELRPISEFHSNGAASDELAGGDGEAHVHLVAIAAGGEIGPHVARFGQLFVCLAGDGWVSSGDGPRMPLAKGQAAYFERGERHAKGSTNGLHALIVQVRALSLSSPGGGALATGGLPPLRRTTATGVEVRAYTPSDRSEWLRMRRALWPEIARADESDDAAAWLARPDAIVIVAARPNGAGLAGFAELGERSFADGCDTSPVAYLEGWYVDEDVRRQGIGAALVQLGEQWARRRGYRELASDALLDNAISHAAHAALGFSEIERGVRFRKAL